VSVFKGASSKPPAPWTSDKEKRFQESPEALGRVYVTNRNRQNAPDSWSSDAERPVTDCSSWPQNLEQGRAGS